jgi:aminoglycoside phosphotransferase family enzyme
MQSIPHSGASAIGGAGVPSIAEKVRFLSAPGAYSHAPASVAVLETHMSYVFLAGDKVYKLKKPVRYPFLDFSTMCILASRR